MASMRDELTLTVIDKVRCSRIVEHLVNQESQLEKPSVVVVVVECLFANVFANHGTRNSETVTKWQASTIDNCPLKLRI